MEQIGASFVATGEVVGQRPNSQMLHQLGVIEQESGLDRRLLRPLSAKLLPPTLPEELGVVDRNQLYDIAGRSRGPLLELAKRYGIVNPPTPSTGCSRASSRPRQRRATSALIPKIMESGRAK